MPLADKDLRDFLGILSEHVRNRVVLVAAGGTALTLLGAKASTDDIDLTGPGDSIAEFQRALGEVPHGFKVDLWADGQVFATALPGDYLPRSRRIVLLAPIELRALHPVDVVVTKLGRYDDRDQEDILAVVRKFRVRPEAIEARAAQVGYAGNEEVYRANLGHLLGTLRRTGRTGRERPR